MCTEIVSNWWFSALNEYSTLIDDPWTPCLTYCNPIFHVRMSTSERRSVNHNSNLIKVVILPQCIENHHRKPTSQYWANTTTLMRFELGLTLFLSLVLLPTWNIGYNMLGRVSRDHQRARNIHPVLKIINLTLSQYTIAITLILWLFNMLIFSLMCVYSCMTRQIILIFTQKVGN